MSEPALQSLAVYSQCIAEFLNRPTVQQSTVAVWSANLKSGSEARLLHAQQQRCDQSQDDS